MEVYIKHPISLYAYVSSLIESRFAVPYRAKQRAVFHGMYGVSIVSPYETTNHQNQLHENIVAPDVCCITK